MQGGGCISMLGGQHLLLDMEGLLIILFRFRVAGMLPQIGCGLMEQARGFWKGELVLLHQFGTHLRVWQVASAFRPVFQFRDGEDLIDGSDGSFCPLALLLAGHLIAQHGLHQAMDAQRFGGGLPLQEGVAPHLFDVWFHLSASAATGFSTFPRCGAPS